MDTAILKVVAVPTLVGIIHNNPGLIIAEGEEVVVPEVTRIVLRHLAPI